jgi:hypothetical protein
MTRQRVPRSEEVRLPSVVSSVESRVSTWRWAREHAAGQPPERRETSVRIGGPRTTPLPTLDRVAACILSDMTS